MSMKIRRLSEEPGEAVKEEGYSGVNSVFVVLERTDLTAFSSRIFRIQPGGHTAIHAHPREHVALVLRGTCRVECEGEVKDIAEGGIINIGPSARHRFSNAGRESLALLVMNLHTD